jgi:hypothetical protein
MFEDKFMELKQKNKVLFNRAVASHSKYLNEVPLDEINEDEVTKPVLTSAQSKANNDNLVLKRI